MAGAAVVLARPRRADGEPANLDRVCRPDVRSRRHRGDVTRQRHEHAGRRGSRPGGGYVHDHGHLAAEDALDDRARRIDKAARRIEDNHQALGLLALGPLDRPFDEAGRDRGDRFVVEPHWSRSGEWPESQVSEWQVCETL
jgi:hypothetical protein